MDCWAVKDREICSLSNQWAEGKNSRTTAPSEVVEPFHVWSPRFSFWRLINHSSSQIRRTESLPCLISCEHWWISGGMWIKRVGRVSYKTVILWDCIESCVLSSLKLLLVVQYCVTLYYIMNKYRIQCYLPFFFRHSLDNNLFDLIYSAHPLSPFWQSIIEATLPRNLFSRVRENSYWSRDCRLCSGRRIRRPTCRFILVISVCKTCSVWVV